MVDNVNSRPKDAALGATSRQGSEQIRRLGVDDYWPTLELRVYEYREAIRRRPILACPLGKHPERREIGCD
jgi:hypothetical protein